jgi:hypothetical protein
MLHADELAHAPPPLAGPRSYASGADRVDAGLGPCAVPARNARISASL